MGWRIFQLLVMGFVAYLAIATNSGINGLALGALSVLVAFVTTTLLSELFGLLRRLRGRLASRQ